ncbi:NUDIX hydrolase [Alteribacter salitolerans]|uniref:NUDIX hydrolase n=1 Tax=Alteribacter salitolerans TaxID=2912333 RepID=UPI003013CB1E
MNALELWDIYNKDRSLTGRKKQRGDLFEANAYHLVVHVCIFNERGEMLIQQRQADKSGWPGMWDVSVGGSALAGETSQEAAERETKEELGYTLSLKDHRPCLTVNFEAGFDDYFLLEKNIQIDSLPMPTEEVNQVKWASKHEVLSMIDEGVFIPYHKNLIKLFYDMRGLIGAHTKR